MRHDPVTHALVGHRLGVSQVRMRQHGDEDLDILLAAAGAQAQRLAREVRQAPKPRRVVEAHLRRRGPAPQTLVEQRAEAAVGIGLAPQGQSLVAVLDPELAPGQPGAAALARRGERFDDRIPVGLHPIAVRTRRRVEPALESLIVEIVRQRPGQPRRLGPGEHMRDRPRAHPDRGGDLRTRQRKIVTVPENVLDLHHAGPLHRAPAFSIRTSDRSGRVGRESAPRTAHRPPPGNGRSG